MNEDYQDGMEDLINKHLPGKYDRAKHLVTSTAQILKHFFDTGTYGDPEKCGPDELPKYWGFVRYLVFDRIKPKFGAENPSFADVKWKDKFLKDLSVEARELSDLIPEDLNNDEWLFIVNISAHMMMKDPLLVDKGYITQYGREQFIAQSIQAGNFIPKDMYEEYLNLWKKENK
jgi:hypothetical protein